MAHSAAEEPIEIDPIEQEVVERLSAQQKFNNALSIFEISVLEVEKKSQRGNLSYHEIADTARKLYNKLQTLGDAYFAQPHDNQEKIAFLNICFGVVEEYRCELEQHQEWKIILSNLMKKLANSVMGLVYTNNFFPITRTALGLRADLFKDALEADLGNEVSNDNIGIFL